MTSFPGWLNGCQQCASPNYNARPNGVEIDLLVIHCISLPEGQYGTGHITDLFLNRLDCSAHPSFVDLQDLQVSCHFVIGRQGQATQYVSTLDRAWHAGVSSFQGRENCNDYAIGIELEGTDQSAFTDQQYVELNRLIAAIQQQHPAITSSRIVGHSDIAPGRKTDPGVSFEWSRINV